MPTPASPRGRRLTVEARREQILDAACRLFADRPFTTVSTADVADAAGVARSLVHHYFGGIREVFLAVAERGVTGLGDDVATAGTEAPIAERLAHNVGAGFDLIEAHRETWLAVIGQSGAFGDPELAALLHATTEHSVERTLADNADVLADTPGTRFALGCFHALIVEATRRWLVGEATREQAHRLITVALRNLIVEVIPALDDA